MKNLLYIFVLAAIAQLVLPWWWVAAPVTFAVCYKFSPKPFVAFGQGFAAVALLWLVFATSLDISNNHLLANRMAEMIFSKPNSGMLMLLLTAVVGGLVGGFSGLAGSFTSKV
jgi:hypothetical protein